MEPPTDKTHRSSAQSWIVRLTAVAIPLVAGILLACWSVYRADQQMREDLLHQAHLLADAIDVESVQSPAVSGVDLKSHQYSRLKEHLRAVGPIDPSWRYLYLAGRNSDGTVFFYLDSEADGSKDQSPPSAVLLFWPTPNRCSF